MPIAHRPLPRIAVVAACFAVAACAQTPAVPPPPTQQPRPQDQAPPQDAAALFRAMAAMRGLEAHFEEEKHLQLLAVPLRSKGTLYFQKAAAGETGKGEGGGYLTRVVEAPEPSTVRISPRELRLQNRDGTEVIDLQRSDKVRAFILSLVHVFAGDEPALTKAWVVQFALDPANKNGWTLTLVPRGAPLDKMMKSLRLEGTGQAVVRIEMHEPNGDRTVTRIVTADPARAFDAAEQKRLFGIEPR